MKTPAWILLIISILGLILLTTVSINTVHKQFFSNEDSFDQSEFLQSCREDARNGAGSIESCAIGAQMAAKQHKQGQRLFLTTELLLTLFHLLHTMALIVFIMKDQPGYLKQSAIWSLIPGVSPGIILGIPFGIWALIAVHRTAKDSG